MAQAEPPTPAFFGTQYRMESTGYAIKVALVLLLVYFAAKAITGPNPRKDLSDLVLSTSAGFLLSWSIQEFPQITGKKPLISEGEEKALDLVTEVANI